MALDLTKIDSYLKIYLIFGDPCELLIKICRDFRVSVSPSPPRPCVLSLRMECNGSQSY